MFDGLQILSNKTKQHQTRWPNGKIVGHQTNISRLARPLYLKGLGHAVLGNFV